jgi:diketogulonate reductase-like aldo/keto reductase
LNEHETSALGGAATVTETAGRRLSSGATIPIAGFGTFGSDRYSPQEIGAAVRGALSTGYRLIDCAAVYGNEPEVGEALDDAFGSGLDRDEVFIQTKVWNDSHAPERVLESVERSLRDLRIERLDAVYIHWPFPNHHPVAADAGARDPHARPYDHEGYMAAWSALEGLVDAGIIGHLGTSNVTIPKLDLIRRDARIQPALNQMELHPCFQQPELFRYCLDHDIQPVGYSPLGSPSRPERDRTADDHADMDHPVVLAIAQERGIHPSAVCLKWAVTRGQIPIPFSVKEAQFTSNLEAMLHDPLTPREIEAMRSVERNSRLIKGQVFLWPGAGSWLDLWDVDGTIPGWDGYLDARPGAEL